jgi:acetolactate synthase-1/2/3 large subunit
MISIVNGFKNHRIIVYVDDASYPIYDEWRLEKNYNIDVIIIVLNNQGYGLIKQTQETWLKSKYAGTDKSSGLSLPDNRKIASSYNIKNFSLKNNRDVRKNIKAILSLRGPILLDVLIDPKARVEPKIEFGKPLHDMAPYIDKLKLKQIMKN